MRQVAGHFPEARFGTITSGCWWEGKPYCSEEQAFVETATAFAYARKTMADLYTRLEELQGMTRLLIDDLTLLNPLVGFGIGDCPSLLKTRPVRPPGKPCPRRVSDKPAMRLHNR
jgi:hypothetical protein